MKNGSYEEVLAKVTEFLQGETKTGNVIGKEFKLGEYTCVPVIKVGMGFGFGGGEGEASASTNTNASGHGEGAGAGAGIGIVPLGFLVSRGADIHFVQSSASHGLSAAIEKAPELLEKFFAQKRTAEPVA